MENTDYNSSIESMEKQIEFLKKLHELEEYYGDVVFFEKQSKTEYLITLL